MKVGDYAIVTGYTVNYYGEIIKVLERPGLSVYFQCLRVTPSNYKPWHTILNLRADECESLFVSQRIL